MIGVIIGAASGALQFWLLYRFTNAVTGGNLNYKTVLFAVSQFLLPLLVLLGCALLRVDSLLFTGVAMAVSLITCAIFRFLIKVLRKQKQRR